MERKNKRNELVSKSYSNVISDIVNIVNSANENVLLDLNAILIKRNWLIGKRIDEELLTNRCNNYGKQLIKKISIELSKYGKGFNKTDLYRYLKFYKCYINIFPTLGKSQNIFEIKPTKVLLPWSYYILFISLNNADERNWYESETIKCNWSYRQLSKNIKTNYYNRVLSNQIIQNNEIKSENNIYEYLKSPYIFDFLNLTKDDNFKESDLENRLLKNLAKFIFELGKGFCFKGNQVHIRSNNKDYYIDLVFYNDILKRNLLIDLKVGKVTSQDIGQMELYLKLFDAKIKQPNDNPSIGLVLSSEIDGDIVRYMSLENPNHILPSKYLTYLPTKQELINEIKKSKAFLNKEKNYGKE